MYMSWLMYNVQLLQCTNVIDNTVYGNKFVHAHACTNYVSTFFANKLKFHEKYNAEAATNGRPNSATFNRFIAITID